MSDIAQEIKRLKENERHYIELVVILAKLNTSYFQELLHRGFAEDAALKLLMAHGFKLNCRSE